MSNSNRMPSVVGSGQLEYCEVNDTIKSCLGAILWEMWLYNQMLAPASRMNEAWLCEQVYQRRHLAHIYVDPRPGGPTASSPNSFHVPQGCRVFPPLNEASRWQVIRQPDALDSSDPFWYPLWNAIASIQPHAPVCYILSIPLEADQPHLSPRSRPLTMYLQLVPSIYGQPNTRATYLCRWRCVVGRSEVAARISSWVDSATSAVSSVTRPGTRLPANTVSHVANVIPSDSPRRAEQVHPPTLYSARPEANLSGSTLASNLSGATRVSSGELGNTQPVETFVGVALEALQNGSHVSPSITRRRNFR